MNDTFLHPVCVFVIFLQDGKTIVDKLLRKKPKPRTTQIPTESSRDIKLKNMRRMIKKNEDIIADAEKKLDLLNIGTSSRTDRSLQYHKNKVKVIRCGNYDKNNVIITLLS